MPQGPVHRAYRLHAPDENIHVDKDLKGIKYAAAIMEHFGRR